MIRIHFYVISRELQICCSNCTNPKPDLLITLNLHFVLNTTPPMLICTVPKLTLLFRVGLMLKMQQRMKLAGEWNCRRCCSSEWNCWRMELQKMLQQRMKLLENGIAEDAAAANEIAGEWNCREKGIAEDATEENGTDTWAENKSAGKWNCECMSREWNCRKVQLQMQIESVKSASNFYSSFSLLLWLQCLWLSTSSTTSGWPLLQISHFIFLLFVLLCHTHIRRDYQQERASNCIPDDGFSTRDRRNPILVCTQNTRPEALQFWLARLLVPRPPPRKASTNSFARKKFSP